MSPKQLEVFVHVVELGSVTAAASALGMSQPSVSKSLALIEQQMGFDLFTRAGGRMQATPEAQEIYEQARRVVDGIAGFERLLERVRTYGVGQLRICATPALAINVLPQAVQQWRRAHPEHGVVMDMFLNNEIEDAVARREYDLGFVLRPSEDLPAGAQIVAGGRMVCVMPPGHRLAALPEVRWEDISPQELIYITTDARIIAALARSISGFRERPVSALETNRYTLAINLVHQGAGVTLVDEFALSAADRAQLEVRPFAPAIGVDVVSISSGRRVIAEPEAAFVEVMRGLLIPRPGRLAASK